MAQFSPAGVADDPPIIVSVYPTVIRTHSFLLQINRLQQVFAVADPLSSAPFAVFSPAAVQVGRMETRNSVLTVNVLPLLFYLFPCRLIGEETAYGESVRAFRVAVVAFVAIESKQHNTTSAANPPAPSHHAPENTWRTPDTSAPPPHTSHTPRCDTKHAPPA